MPLKTPILSLISCRLINISWKREDFIFDKYRKDKAKKHLETGKTAPLIIIDELAFEKTLKDKGEPPDGFRFIESE